MDLEKYINDRVEVAESGCWLWKRSLSSSGYGNAWNGETVLAAHRHVYMLLVGPIPDGLVLDHLCSVPRCVNPAHLEPVTQRENLRRAELQQHLPGPIRTECATHGTEFMRVYKSKRHPSGTFGACRKCLNEYQQARRSRLRSG